MQNRTWNIDTAHSGIHFTARHMVITKVRGAFRSWTGTIRLDEEDLTRSSVAVVIDAASIDTRNEMRDGHLRSADFFDVDRYPTLGFRSTGIEHAGGGDYRVTGELTIRDITRSVVLEAELEGKARDAEGGDRIGFSARARIDRREFGLTWNQLLGTGNLLVGDNIEIAIEVQAVAAAAASDAAA
jgi:polyisoprenoid-binding protein YceI